MYNLSTKKLHFWAIQCDQYLYKGKRSLKKKIMPSEMEVAPPEVISGTFTYISLRPHLLQEYWSGAKNLLGCSCCPVLALLFAFHFWFHFSLHLPLGKHKSGQHPPSNHSLTEEEKLYPSIVSSHRSSCSHQWDFHSVHAIRMKQCYCYCYVYSMLIYNAMPNVIVVSGGQWALQIYSGAIIIKIIR